MGQTILSTRLMAVKLAKFADKHTEERIKKVTQRPELWSEELDPKASFAQRSLKFGTWHYQRPEGAN